MEVRKVIPSHLGWLEATLDQSQIDFLWERINNHQGDCYKKNLAGNISKSFSITDSEDDWFFNEVLVPQVVVYRGMHGSDPVMTHMDGNLQLYLRELWVNYQYQGEVNPFHFHGGMYSFAIWLKVPTDWRDQIKLPFLEGTPEISRKPNSFEFEYLDMLGGIRNYGYRLDQSREWDMVFFPSALRHSVYPFYDCEEPRISVSGNLWYRRP